MIEPRHATAEARDELAAWLSEQAELEARSSRDFGRGFAHAIRVLRLAPVMQDSHHHLVSGA